VAKAPKQTAALDKRRERLDRKSRERAQRKK
jgi:hypothetical protein